MSAVTARKSSAVDEADLITRALRHDESAIRMIIQANNRRLYRVARSVVRDDAEAEDVLQDAYLQAFRSLEGFRGGSKLATWLTRIVLNAALQRLRRPPEPATPIDPSAHGSTVIAFPLEAPNPERDMAQRQLCQLVERAIDDLPVEFRTVLLTRVVEEMSIEDTAQLLGGTAGHREDEAASRPSDVAARAGGSGRPAVQRRLSVRRGALQPHRRRGRLPTAQAVTLILIMRQRAVKEPAMTLGLDTLNPASLVKRPQPRRLDRSDAEEAFRTIIRWVGEDPDRDGLADTPARMARAFEEYFSGYAADPAALLQKTFEETSGYDELIVLRGIRFVSHCEHHLAPIVGRAWVGYVPDGRVVGISKLARVVDAFARRLQIQERLTAQIAAAIEDVLRPRGVGVILKASTTA